MNLAYTHMISVYDPQVICTSHKNPNDSLESNILKKCTNIGDGNQFVDGFVIHLTGPETAGDGNVSFR